MSDHQTEQRAAELWRDIDARIDKRLGAGLKAQSGIVPGVAYGSAIFDASGRAVWGGAPSANMTLLAQGNLYVDRPLPSDTAINIIDGDGINYMSISSTPAGSSLVTISSDGHHYLTVHDPESNDQIFMIFTSGLIAPATWSGQELWIQARRTGASDADSCMARIAPNGSGISAFWASHWSHILADETQIFPELHHNYGSELTLIAMDIIIMRVRL